MGEQKGGSAVTCCNQEPKGSLQTSEGFRVGITQICLENEDGAGGRGGGGEGSRKSSKVIIGDHSSEVTFKGGIG